MNPLDPRSSSLDAAVEAAAWQIARTIVMGPDVAENEREALTTARAAIEAALPHLQASPEGIASEPRPSRAKGSEVSADAPFGEAQEPSEDAERAAFVVIERSLRDGAGINVSEALRAAYAVDRR